MILLVQPTKILKGNILLPSSKSYSIRTVIVAACGGFSKIKNFSFCNDAKVALQISRFLGAKIKRQDKRSFSVKANFFKKQKISRINVKESGTALRFLLPLLSSRQEHYNVIGEGTLRSRPNQHLTKVLRRMGRNVRGQGDKETVPICIKEGILKGGNIFIDGSLSSQFISAFLIASPMLEENTQLSIKGRTVVSRAYITMTLQVLKKAGINIRQVSKNCFEIKGRQKFKGLKNFSIPSDYGLAAFSLAAGALSKSNLVLKGFLDDRLVQADGKILDFLKIMGVKIKKTKKALAMSGPYVLKGGSFSLKDCPDLLPIMAVLALFAKNKTRLYGIEHARIKESDRISDLRRELLKIGAKIIEKKGEMIIYPQQNYKENIMLNPYQDHRLAMAFCVLGLQVGVKIKDIECVAKSYPDFVSDFRKIGAKIKKI